MLKNPNLKIVGAPASTGTRPPANLGEAGSKLWQSIQSEYRIDDAGGIAMLLQLCLPQTGQTNVQPLLRMMDPRL